MQRRDFLETTAGSGALAFWVEQNQFAADLEAIS